MPTQPGRSKRHITRHSSTVRPGAPKKPLSKEDINILAREDKARRQAALAERLKQPD